jgi:opacity protein-like surface antigen
LAALLSWVDENNEMKTYSRRKIMMKKIVLLILSIISLPVFAYYQDTPYPQMEANKFYDVSPHAYVGGTFGAATFTQSSDNYDRYGRYYDDSTSQNAGIAMGLNFGYMFSPYVGAEVFYSNNGSFTAKFYDDKNKLESKAKLASTSYGLRVKGVFPLYGTPWSLYGKLGIANIDSKYTVKECVKGGCSTASPDPASGITFAIGGSYAFLPNVTADMELQGVGSDQNNYGNTWSSFGFGLTYSF